MLSDSETDDLHTLTINEHYAKAFEYRKEREELIKLKEKYGSDYSGSGSSDVDSDDSEDTDEDSDGEELTPAVDAAILRTLARIRKKDPAIYEGGRQVFDEEHTKTRDKAPVTKPKTKKEKSKPLTIREAALASALADANSHSRSPSPPPLTHAQEQALLRSETRVAFHSAVGFEDQGDDDDLLIPRSRSRDENELEEEEYKSFLQREVGEDLHNIVTVDANQTISASGDVGVAEEADKKAKKKKKDKKERENGHVCDEVQGKSTLKKGKPKEETDQEFLMNYIFNRGWIDRSNRRVPTYNEIIESSPKRPKGRLTQLQTNPDADKPPDDDTELQNATFSEEDSFDDLADAFETSYNFRFEEPCGALIATFPRNVASARRESTTRKDARVRKKERGEAEKQALLEARREEIRKERALVEAAVAEHDPVNDAILIERDTTNNKRSKKQQRKEELDRLKSLKAKELRRKLEMVSSEGGLGDIDDDALAHLDLEAEWDPSKHDAQMAELYGGDDIGDEGDAEKPIWDDDIDIDDIEPPANSRPKAELKKKKKKKSKKADEYEDGGVDIDEMDADLDTGASWDDGAEDWRGTEEERRRKVDAYMDEVVNRLGFSGITSHMPTRFHYTSVAQENYGLTPAEILLATDAELNSYVGLKKLAPYRVDKGGKAKKSWDPKRAQRLSEFRETLHSRVGSRYEGFWSLAGANNTKGRATEMQEKKGRKGRKERAKLKAMQGKQEDEAQASNEGAQSGVRSTPQTRKHDPDTISHRNTSPRGEPERDMRDYPPKKRRRRHKESGEDG